jgi:predicted secreted protein
MSFMGRWPWIQAMAFCLLAVPAHAGDRALIDFIGYSSDLRYLAIEEYGELDGVGVAYSGIDIIDLTTGEFADGSPFYQEADEDKQQPLSEIRAAAQAAAKAALTKLDVVTPVEIEALSGDGDLGPATEMRFGLPAYGLVPGTTQGKYQLKLSTYKLPKSEVCEAKIGRAGQGFALSLSGAGKSRELHRDGKTLPEWRGCPIGYRLYAVVAPHEQANIATTAAIVSAYPFDFEGPSRRFVVVPIAAKQ